MKNVRVDVGTPQASGRLGGGQGQRVGSRVAAAADSDLISQGGADAVCGGSSDETVLNRLIDEIPAGGSLVLLEGTYVLNGPVRLPDRFHLRGQGRASILQAAPDAPPGPLVVYTLAGNNQAVSDLAFDGNDRPGSVGVESPFNLGGFATIHDCAFTRFAETAIKIGETTAPVKVAACSFENNTTDIAMTITLMCSVVDCTMTGARQSSITMQDSTHCQIQGNVFRDCNSTGEQPGGHPTVAAIMVNGGRSHMVGGNTFRGCVGAFKSRFNPNFVASMALVNNTVTDSIGTPLQIATRGSVINGNTVRAPGRCLTLVGHQNIVAGNLFVSEVGPVVRAEAGASENFLTSNRFYALTLSPGFSVPLGTPNNATVGNDMRSTTGVLIEGDSGNRLSWPRNVFGLGEGDNFTAGLA